MKKYLVVYTTKENNNRVVKHEYAETIEQAREIGKKGLLIGITDENTGKWVK